MARSDCAVQGGQDAGEVRMTAAYRVVVADRKDIAIVSVVCDECNSAISLGVATASIPASCASCGKQYDQNTTTALAALARFHREAKTAEEKAGKPIFRFEMRDLQGSIQ